jgi:hypothetical protein
MSLKVYLAGGYYQENDWRYEVVSGLKGNTPLVPLRSTIEKWGILPNSIFGCLDFVGPYPEDDMILRHRIALTESDIVFLWSTAEYLSDIAKMGCELGYAGALEKIIGVGCDHEDNETFRNIEHAVYMAGPWYPTPAVADNPTKALRLFLQRAMEGLPLEKVIEFRKSGYVAREICGQQYEKCGYVYVIRADTGHYKIGRTNNVPNRMKLFAVKLPFNFEIITHFPCEDMYEAESHLHDFFSEKRVNGEWFTLNQDDVEALKTVTRFTGGTLFDKNDTVVPNLYHPSDIPWYFDLIPEQSEV